MPVHRACPRACPSALPASPAHGLVRQPCPRPCPPALPMALSTDPCPLATRHTQGIRAKPSTEAKIRPELLEKRRAIREAPRTVRDAPKAIRKAPKAVGGALTLAHDQSLH